jgi:hypothetical protein
MCPVGPRNMNVWPGGATSYCVCQSYAWVWVGGNRNCRVNIDVRWDLGVLTSHQSQSCLAWNGITRGLHYPIVSRQSVKIMASVSWDSGVIQVDTLPYGIVIMRSVTVAVFVEAITLETSKDHLSTSSECSSKSNLTKASLALMGWQIMNSSY